MIRVALSDDSPEMRVTLRLLLGLSENIEVVCVTSNGQEAVDCVKNLQPDVLVMDIRMPMLNGFEATRQIIVLEVPTRVILISSDLGSFIVKKAAAVGAKGFVPKENVVALLVRAIETVHRGGLFFAE
jgi:DNA-binding NarL/FixJ family response regulator